MAQQDAAAECSGAGESALDPRFEFDAPRYCDFSIPSPDTSSPDRWFSTAGPQGLSTPEELSRAPDAPSPSNSGKVSPVKVSASTPQPTKPANGRAPLASLSTNVLVQQQPALAAKRLSPDLETAKRKRPARFRPTSDVEAEAMAALPPFKARPFRRSLFAHAPEQPGPSQRRPTVPEPFELRIDRRKQK
ncbi:hypothetical protein H632_c1904p0 [Helicosporidium sp. ATCC 50920]|nr:hypothetical protein H632_c1904p0 [Helicosporidium sp. ATCC 50920]|eukprot:KDD73709.1 hypothetical protein H632_c1904p0 [Helicosporidium sp. ATCC 50920]